MINFKSIEPVLFEGKETKAKEVLAHLLEQYRRPSFGSMSKRDVDNMMFVAMQDVGLIDMNPQAYEVVQALHVTSAKARNLIYASALSREQDFDVDKALQDALAKPRFLSGTDKMIGIDIDNPLLIDHLKFKLRHLGYITDGSFNQDLVKMTPEAMSALYVDYVPENTRAALMDQLVKAGIEEDSSAPLINGMKKFFSKLAEKIAEAGSDELLKKVTETLPKILLGAATKAAIAALIA